MNSVKYVSLNDLIERRDESLFIVSFLVILLVVVVVENFLGFLKATVWK